MSRHIVLSWRIWLSFQSPTLFCRTIVPDKNREQPLFSQAPDDFTKGFAIFMIKRLHILYRTSKYQPSFSSDDWVCSGQKAWIQPEMSVLFKAMWRFHVWQYACSYLCGPHHENAKKLPCPYLFIFLHAFCLCARLFCQWQGWLLW